MKIANETKDEMDRFLIDTDILSYYFKGDPDLHGYPPEQSGSRLKGEEKADGGVLGIKEVQGSKFQVPSWPCRPQ
ncbi:MAG TPA: hypothetical protein VFG54_02055 [Prolixibacteraceae bacterium]|nr:hypothetical protein [Prolixibacteraceae bacterium]